MTPSGALETLNNPIGGLASSAAGTASTLVLQGISSWVLGGTAGALREVATAVGAATAPNLNGTWFSATYWRVAALAAMLTLPFLCAAAVQAVARADMGLLARAAFGYLPLSVLGVSLAAPLTMLALAGTDQMSSFVSADAAAGGARFLDGAAAAAVAMAGSGAWPFFAVFVGLLALMAALALALELLLRAAAVYVVVLMLPLAFAALVWPARRVWAARLVELLASLILSKFVIVAVLSLASAAFTGGRTGISELLVAMALLLLSTFAPWALMRILPFTELAAGAAGVLRGELHGGHGNLALASGEAAGSASRAMDLPARLLAHTRRAGASSGEGSWSVGDPQATAGDPQATAGDPQATAGEPQATAGEPGRPVPGAQAPPERHAGRPAPAEQLVVIPTSPHDGLVRLGREMLTHADAPSQTAPPAGEPPAPEAAPAPRTGAPPTGPPVQP